MTYITGHTRPFYADLPPLTTRVMDAGGTEVLEIMAKRERACYNKSSIQDINLRWTGREKGVSESMANLDDLGYVSLVSATGYASYRLTDAGWAQVGGKPGWV